jgi:hypothetical protein
MGINVGSKGFVRGIMQTLKIVALGIVFSVAGTVGYLLLGVLINIVRGPISTGHATALSAIVGGLEEATIFNPFYSMKRRTSRQREYARSRKTELFLRMCWRRLNFG